MTDAKRYQVVSACVLVPVVDADGASLMRTMYGGSVFMADPANAKIVHNVDSGYIVTIAPNAVAGVDGSGTPLVNDKPTVGDGNPGDPVPSNDPGTVNDTAHQAAAASDAAAKADAKDKAEAKAKAGRPSAAEKAELVEQAVAAGMSKAEAEKATVADLRAALNR